MTEDARQLVAALTEAARLRAQVEAMRPVVNAILRHYDVAALIRPGEVVIDEILRQLAATDAAVADEVRWYRSQRRPEGGG